MAELTGGPCLLLFFSQKLVDIGDFGLALVLIFLPGLHLNHLLIELVLLLVLLDATIALIVCVVVILDKWQLGEVLGVYVLIVRLLPLDGSLSVIADGFRKLAHACV